MDPTLTRIESEIPRLRRYARFLCGDRHQADDLVQECLVRAIEKLHTWQPGTNLGGWLFAILRNFYFDAARRRRRYGALEVENSLPEVAVSGGHEAHVQCLELWEALNSLSPEHREVLGLVVAEGLTYQETARVLDVAVGTVRSRLSRARSLLRLYLDGVTRATARQSSRPSLTGVPVRDLLTRVTPGWHVQGREHVFIDQGRPE